jgi:small subunit ribosomal protein S6
MSFYETVFIARQDISSAQAEALADTFAQVAQEHEGNVVGREYWGLRNLSYRIKKNRKGHYVLLNINAPARAIQELERQLRINEDVLRYMSVKVDKFEQSSNKNKREREENKAEGAPAEETVQ